MFKVESSSASAPSSSALSLNPQNNFDFELSFCDDGATDDLFESFASPSAMDSGGLESQSESHIRIKTEPEDPEVSMSTDAVSENTASSSSTISSSLDKSPTPTVAKAVSTKTSPSSDSLKTEKTGNKLVLASSGNGSSIKKGEYISCLL